MSGTTIPMKMAAGAGTPSQVVLSDSSSLTPDSTGLINAPASELISLLVAGWQIQIAANSTHVP